MLSFGNQEEKVISLERKNGEKVIVRVIFSLNINNENQLNYHAMITDVTDQIKKDQEMTSKIELYENLLATAKSIIFSYDNVTKIMNCSRVSPKGIQEFLVVNDFPNKVQETKKIHPDYKKEYMKIMLTAYQKEQEGSYDFLGNDQGKSYTWKRLLYKVIKNSENDNYRVIGRILDIQADVEKATKMKERAQRDLMSGLYNRVVTEELMKERLNSLRKQETVAFFMFDIDQFKEINDEYGHLVGDKMISKIANLLKQKFGSKAIIGRLGGDEFAVLSEVENTEAKALAKAEEILKGTRELSKSMNLKFTITTSIGISFAPRDGKSFKTLFMNADKAMYKAKNEGKDCCKIYKS